MTEEKLFFDNGSGIRLCGLLRTPEKHTEKIVILAHGFSSHKNKTKYVRFADDFAKKGIATLRFDFFAHGESEGAYEDISISEGANDILKAIELAKTKGFSKIGLIGVSFGGISSAIAASKTADLESLILICPVSDYKELWIERIGDDGINEWKRTGYYEYYDHEGNLQGKIRYEFLADSENNIVYDIADKISAPTLIIHGTADKTVPFAQSEKTAKLIGSCILEPIEGAGHQFEEKEHFERMISLAVNFTTDNLS